MTAPNALKEEFLSSNTIPLSGPRAQIDPEQKKTFLEQSTTNLNEYVTSLDDEKATAGDYIRDLFVQGSRGVAKKFTWPLDVLKLAMLGEGLSDIDELEQVYNREGIEFDRNDYIKNVLDASEIIPTQELLEKGLSSATGFDFDPKTSIGDRVRQGFTIATLNPGGLARKAVAGTTAALTTEGLEQAGVSKTGAEITGDIAGGLVGAVEAVPRILGRESEQFAQTAARHNLPFWEGIAADTGSTGRTKILSRTANHLREDLGMSVEEAMNNIVSGRLPVRNVREAGGDLEVLGTLAYDRVRNIARTTGGQHSTDPLIQNIDTQIARIRARAPSPSESETAAIRVLEREREALVENPVVSSEQLINQHQNWNNNLRAIYRTPEFSGKENAIRFAYEELKDVGSNMLEQDLGDSFRAVNRFYSETQNLAQVEGILARTMRDGQFNPRALERVLQGRDGRRLLNVLGEDAVNELRDIARFGNRAQTRVLAFAERGGQQADGILSSWGPLAPLIFHSKNTVGAVGKVGVGLMPYVRGYFVSRPAALTQYRSIMEMAARGNFTAMKAHFDELYNIIADDFGDFDEFIKNGIDSLNIWEPPSNADELDGRLK